MAQGTFSQLDTGSGNALLTEMVGFSIPIDVVDPSIRMKLGFATDEVFQAGSIFDSFTITLQSLDATITLVLATMDASGVVWAPSTPGTTTVDINDIQIAALNYPSLSPVLSTREAFNIEVKLPDEVIGHQFTAYFDLFDNQNGTPSQAFLQDLVVVPEPDVLLLITVGLVALFVFRKKKWMLGSRAVSVGMVVFVAAFASATRSNAQIELAFPLNGTDITLAEATPDVAVFFRSMRLNRALNVWNVEVSVTNTSQRVLAGPLVLLVDGFTGTTGPELVEGTIAGGKGFYDVSALAPGGSLAPGQGTSPRTLTLGRSVGSPTLATKFYGARPPVVAALGITRSLNEAGQPLPGVALEISGPVGSGARTSDAPSGVASFGQGPGEHVVKFSTAGYLPVWRKQSLSLAQTTVLPNPRLTRRSLNTFNVSPLGGVTVSNAANTITINLGAGAVSQATTVTLTPLSGQSLPAFLPMGWSPLNAFWLEATSPLGSAVTASLKPDGAIGPGETVALVRWNETALQWIVTQTLAGNGANRLTVNLTGTGAYALVAGDVGDTAPPVAQNGQPLAGFIPLAIDAGQLTASGSVTPPVSPASVVAAFVTGTANLEVRHSTTKLPSGYVLRGEVTETYLMSDGSLRLTPQYEHFIVGYQRPGDQDPFTLHASFPMRPLLLFGADQLEEATVRVDVLPETAFDGRVLDATGGQISDGAVRILAGTGRFTGPSALRLRRLDATVFTNLLAAGHDVIGAFDLTVDRSTLGEPLIPQLSGAPANSLFVLARLLSEVGFYGLQPVERLASDANGNLASLEPLTGERLPGLRGSGQFVLIQVNQLQGLIIGIARNGAGQLQAGMPVRITGLPWLTLTDEQGSYQLIAPAGDVEIGVTDPANGDTGFANITIPDPQNPLAQDLATAPAGPRVAGITPNDSATKVPRVLSVVIRFNEAVNPGTVIGGAIQLLAPGDVIVPAALSLNLKNTIATLSPATDLDANTVYRVRLAGTIADPGGLPIEGQTEFSFTTVPLSARIATAQLVIYEPGATNVPAAILDDIPAFEPGEDPFAIVVHGQPGVADPDVPVILVNESTGETQTVLSKLDGSFSSFISGTEEDFISATFVNLNGTRVYVPVSRQEFDDGFVGLYPQGGILEAQSDGGPVQVYIQPEAVPTRTKFRIKPISTAQLLQLTGGVAPEAATIAGGAMKVEVEGTSPREPMQISFPVNLAQLGYPTNESPSDVAAVLARVRDSQGGTTFEVLDQMVFEPSDVGAFPVSLPQVQGIRLSGAGDPSIGTLLTAIGFIPSLTIGLVTPLVTEYVIMPLIVGSRPVVIKGVTQFLPTDAPTPATGAIDEFSQGVASSLTESFNSALIVNPVPGAFVVLRTVDNPPTAAPGRLQPGNVHATSDADGSYLMVAPQGGPKYLVMATHPAYSDRPAVEVRAASDISLAGAVFKPLIFHEPNAAEAQLHVNISHAPQYPAPDQDCEVLISAFRGPGAAPEILVPFIGATNLTGGTTVLLSDVTVSDVTVVNNGFTRQWRGIVRASQPLQAELRIKVDGQQTLYPINFSGVIPPVLDVDLPKPDTNDVHGPIVISTFPPEGGYLDASGDIKILFNKPIDRRIEMSGDGIVLNGPTAGPKPVVILAVGQKSLVLNYAGLEPDQEYSLTLTAQAVRDLAGQPIDQRPSTPEADSFRLRFRTSPTRVQPLFPFVENGRGAAIQGETLYVIEGNTSEASLLSYGIKDPSNPKLLSRTRLPGQPRDLVVIPQFAYRRTRNAPAETNDLVVVVGGDLDTRIDTLGNVTSKGQYLNVFNVGDPSDPLPLASPIVSFRVGSAVTKVRWSPPHLIYQEFGADIQQLGLVNLQELIIGYGETGVQGARAGRDGKDLNGDGDYVDEIDGEMEVVPFPEYPPAEFFGKKFAYVLGGTTQKILDFDPIGGGQLIGITVTRGLARDVSGTLGGQLRPSYRTLGFNLATADPTDSAFPFDANAYPRWVTLIPSLTIITNGVSYQPMVALVSLQPDSDELQKLAVIDVSLPRAPKLINKIAISSETLGGAMQSVRLREDGLLEVAGSKHLLLLDSTKFGITDVPPGLAHPSIIGFIPEAGAGSRSLGNSTYGYRAVADGARDVLIQTAPVMRFVNFPASSTVVNPATVKNLSAPELSALMITRRTAFAIPPARAKGRPELNIPSDLDPPLPASHFHVWVEAPGASGKTIELGLESVNHAGRPLSNFGFGFAPVRAISTAAQDAIGQRPRPDCGAPIRALTAWRMSDDPRSVYYNRYLSRPFAMLANETLSAAEHQRLLGIVDREILHSGAGLRAFIDSSQSANQVIGLFAARVDEKRKLLLPVASEQAITLFHPYIMGDNPPPAGGYVALPATYGMIAAHSGEVRTEATDMTLPSPRMPIVIERAIGNQDSYEGPFGVGWDFNYNQRLTELDPLSFPLGLQMPVILRGTRADSDIAGSQDVLFNTGMGKVLRFRWVSTNMPPEYASDPLVADFKYAGLASDYYLPAKGQGIFDLLVKLKDGRFERLTPGGTRYRYAGNGRLEMIIDRFPLNRHELEYDRNGWLVRIDDRSVSSARYVEFGHYRMAGDPDFREDLDELTTNSRWDGKVRRLRNHAKNPDADVLYAYDGDGFMIRRDGVKVDGENEGFSGRAQTHYTYINCRFAGVKVTGQGSPLFTANSVENSKGKMVVQTGTGFGGSVGVNVPLENTAASLENQVSSADLADSSKAEFQFDKMGHLSSVKSSGSKGAAAVSQPVYDDNGLIKSIGHPEGNSEAMTYDSGNPNFRSRGNLIRHSVDPGSRGGEGYTLEFNFDPRYNLKSGAQKNANGLTITHVLRADGRETKSIIHGTAGRDDFTHNDKGQLVGEIDSRGVGTTTAYFDNTGFVQRSVSGESTYEFYYDGGYASQMGKPSEVELPAGLPTLTKHNRKLQSVETSRGELKQLTGYDEQGRPVFQQQFLGDGRTPILRSEFDEKGFMTQSVTEGLEVNGAMESLEYKFTPDEMSRVKSMTMPQGTVQTHEFDDRGNLLRRTTGEYVEEFTVDLNGNTTEIRKGGDLVQSTVYDGLDRPIAITRHVGDKDELSEFTYFREGQPKSETLSDDEFGLAKQMSFDEVDELGRPVSFTIAGTTINPVYSYVYDQNSVAEIGPRMTLRRSWNAAGHLLSRTSAILTENFSPDGNGMVREVERLEDGATFHDFFEFDTLDNPKSYRDDLGTVYKYTTRADGKFEQIINARTNITELDYSAKGELLLRKRADGMELRHEFDELRHATYSGDPDAGAQKSYDQNIRLESATQRDGALLTYGSFDSRLQPQTLSIPGGEITMVYDLKQRITERDVSYQSTAYAETRSFDAQDRLRVSKYQQDEGTENTATFEYDLAGPLLSATFQEDGTSFVVGYEYYEDRTRKTVLYPSGSIVTESRDDSGRLTGVGDQSGTFVRATSWQGNSQPKAVELGPVSIANRYDVRGRLVASRATKTADGKVLVHMRYQYDAANNLEIRQFLHRGGRADSFSYDQGERVSSAQIGALPSSAVVVEQPLYRRDYLYHSGGLDYLTSVANTNLGLSPPPFASSWANHDAFLLPGSVDGFDRSPADPRGNVQVAALSVRPKYSAQPSPDSASLVHNGNGNLIRVLRDDGTLEENFYQPDGLRYRRQVSNGPVVLDHRHFVYDSAGRLLEEYDLASGSPFLMGRYFYGTSDAPEAADFYNSISGQTNRFYYLRDAVESVIAVVDENGDVVERAWYDTFGQPSLEQEDVRSPVLQSVFAGDGGSLIVALSESVLAPLIDPGEGEGIVPVPTLVGDDVLKVSVNSGDIAGTVEFLSSFEGHAPFSVFRFTPSQALPTTPTGVLGWWPADLSVSDVASGNNGALRGGATLAGGLIQQAFALNGAGAYVEITNTSAVNFGSGDFTVSSWVNFNTTGGEQVLVEKWSQSASTGWSLEKRQDQRLRLLLGNGAGATSLIETSAPLNFPTNTWIQIAARRQGDQFTLFTNGVAVAVGSQTVSLSSSATLKFGSREGSSLFFNGRIDEVTIFSRALSDQEIVSVAGGVGLPGPVTVTFNDGTVMDEWGNLNEQEKIDFMLVDEPGTIFYSAQPAPETGASSVARSSVGSSFLFHGQYFDYDTGLIYLRARFYDPFSGMFLEPDPLGYEDSVNLYAGMGNNPVGYRDPSGLNYFTALMGRAARLVGRSGQEASAVIKPSFLSRSANEISDVTWLERAGAAADIDNMTPLLAERVGKFAGRFHGLDDIDAAKPLVLGLDGKKSYEVADDLAHALDPGSFVNTANIIGGRHLMNPGLRGAFSGEVLRAIDEGRKIIVDVSNMSGKTLAAKIESAVARKFVSESGRLADAEGVLSPFATDTEMLFLFEKGQLSNVTFVQRFGDDVYELANPFIQQVAKAPSGMSAVETGSLILGDIAWQSLRGAKKGARYLRLGTGFDRAGRNFQSNPEEFQIP